MQRTAGQCLCGAIAFEYDGHPKWVAHCHCESCRRATSSPVTTWIGVDRAAFRFTRGIPKYFASSAGVRRGFCGNCGSPLTYEAERAADEVHFYAASLDDPSSVTVDRHVFAEEQLPWFEVSDHLPRFASISRGGAKPMRIGPWVG
jgi:hypothetical protein